MTALGPIDALIARALRGQAPWPADIDHEAVAARALYHGVAGILTDHAERIADWPAGLRDRLHAQALAQTMWDLRHRLVVSRLLDRMAAEDIPVRVLKGTALAYSAYPRPGQRARGDSDILIAPRDLERSRAILAEAGFVPFLETDTASAADRLQEIWTLAHTDGSRHTIDLHWSMLNSPLLDAVLPVELAFEQPVALPALGPNARALPGDVALLYASLHRARHIVTPYFVNGVAHYGGDRLIWLVDIDHLWCALDAAGRADAVRRAVAGQVASVVATALGEAREHLATPVAESDLAALRTAPTGAAARYLTADGQAARALRDLAASRGMASNWRYLRNRLFPPAAFMRAKYPNMGRWPLAALYVRRFLSLWQHRPGQSR